MSWSLSYITALHGNKYATITKSLHYFPQGGGSIEAIQRIRRNYLTNRAIARVAEALHLTVTRKVGITYVCTYALISEQEQGVSGPVQ